MSNVVLAEHSIKRIIELEPCIHELINHLDMGIYTNKEIINSASMLSDVLGQVDADLITLIDALND